ncbi:MAG: pyridoxamine 5'-phosphate oxidase family protein [Gammaproteobacteria bacterium]|nr:pyridoxamine 5'-phosphate oxidase family protein [Gammaproteobacteria bacterium]TVQ50246.1 MAG: pyridoxamine 5'-phosphate oxidase [Gammaproteobacteria bacterium]
MGNPAEHYETYGPQEWLAHAWSSLARGALSARHGFHVGQLANVASDGAPQVRTVVLRGVSSEARQLICHTDRRAGKCAELTARPRVAWHFYDARHKLQLRLHGDAEVHREGPLWTRRWQASSVGSRRCYLTVEAPGTPQARWDSGFPAALRDRRPEPDESEAGRQNFAVVVSVIDRLELLWLSAHGHRRLRFAWLPPGAAAGRWDGGWVTP